MNIDLKVNSDSFTQADLAQYEHWIGHFVDQLITNLNNKVIDFSALAEQSSAQLLTFNQSSDQALSVQGFVQDFSAAVSAYPSHKLYFEHSHMTYQECDRKANQLARYMTQKWQLEAGSLVGILLERNENMLIAMLAVLKLGAAYVPLDPSYPKVRLEFMNGDADLKLVITEQVILQQNLLEHGEFCVLDNTDVAKDIALRSDTGLDITVSLDDLAYVIYTSDE